MVKKRNDAQFYYDALRHLARHFMTYEQIKRDDNDIGLGYVEELEMAYHNMQEHAQWAIKGKRRPK